MSNRNRKGTPITPTRKGHTQSEQAARARQHPLIALLAPFLARGGFAAYLPITLVTICMFTGASWQIFLPATDPARYQCYALTFWLGSQATNLLPSAQCAFLHIVTTQPSFTMLPIEYPSLTLIPFSLALLAPIPYYQLAFAFIMSLTSALICWLLLRFGPRGSALIFALYLFVGALATATIRFDLLPAALTLLCLIAAERRRWTAAYIALAFGVLLKIYPILLLPALFIAEQQYLGRLHSPASPPLSPSPSQHLSSASSALSNPSVSPGFPTFPINLLHSLSLAIRRIMADIWTTLRAAPQWRWRNTILFLAIIGAVTGFFALLNFQGAVASQIFYFIKRPIQIEATGSLLPWLAHLMGAPLTTNNEYGSINLISPLNPIVSFGSTFFLGVGCLFVIWLQWRRKLDLTQSFIALLLVFIATGKVFSPQYLIWLIPLLAYAGAFNAFWLFFWGSVSFLTSYVYIFIYSHTSQPGDLLKVSGFFEIMTIRNSLFVLITLAYLFNWFNVRRRKQPLTSTDPDRHLSASDLIEAVEAVDILEPVPVQPYSRS